MLGPRDPLEAGHKTWGKLDVFEISQLDGSGAFRHGVEGVWLGMWAGLSHRPGTSQRGTSYPHVMKPLRSVSQVLATVGPSPNDLFNALIAGRKMRGKQHELD